MPDTKEAPQEVSAEDVAWWTLITLDVCPEHDDGRHRPYLDSADDYSVVRCDCGEVPGR